MVLHQAFFGNGFLQLIPSELRVEIGRINDLQAHLGGKGIGALAHQHHMRAFRHHGVRGADGVAYRRNRGNRTAMRVEPSMMDASSSMRPALLNTGALPGIE